MICEVKFLTTRSATDFTKRNGMGGESIYGGQFADEDLIRPLDAEAYVPLLLRI